MSDVPTAPEGKALVGGLGSFVFKDDVSLEKAISGEHELAKSGKLTNPFDGRGLLGMARDKDGNIAAFSGKTPAETGSNVISLEGAKKLLGAFAKGPSAFGEQINENAKANPDGLASKTKGLIGNIAFMALGGAMIVAGIWMLGGANVAQVVAQKVGVKTS